MYKIDTIDDKLRKLAKSNYYQNLFSASQKCFGISLFQNVCNFSGIQVRFLYWLSVYEMLFTELSKHEDDFLTEAVINDNDRTDAYLIYRNKKHDYLWKKYRREESLAKHKSKHPNKHKDGKSQLIEVDLRRE